MYLLPVCCPPWPEPNDAPDTRRASPSPHPGSSSTRYLMEGKATRRCRMAFCSTNQRRDISTSCANEMCKTDCIQHGPSPCAKHGKTVLNPSQALPPPIPLVPSRSIAPKPPIITGLSSSAVASSTAASLARPPVQETPAMAEVRSFAKEITL